MSEQQFQALTARHCIAGVTSVPARVVRDLPNSLQLRLERCPYCAQFGHRENRCPHMDAHLADPDPKHDGLRDFIKSFPELGTE